jgi:hypothetical protein
MSDATDSSPSAWTVGTLLIAPWHASSRRWLLRVEIVRARYVETQGGQRWSRTTGVEVRGPRYVGGYASPARMATHEAVAAILRGRHATRSTTLRKQAERREEEAARAREQAARRIDDAETLEAQAAELRAQAAEEAARDAEAEALAMMEGTP